MIDIIPVVTPLPIPTPNAVIRIDPVVVQKVADAIGLKLPTVVNKTMLDTVLTDLVDSIATTAPPKGSPWNVWVKFAITTAVQVGMAGLLIYSMFK